MVALRLKGLLALGCVALLVLLVVGFWAVSYFDVSPRFLLKKALEKAQVDNSQLDRVLRSPQLYASRPLDGVVRKTHPRILLPQLSDWNGQGIAPVMAERMALHRSHGTNVQDYQACGRKHAMSYVVCWLTTGDSEAARNAINELLKTSLAPPDMVNNDSHSWEWALAFDLLSLSPVMTANEREAIAAKLRIYLEILLELLDGESASLWHGRSSLAAQAWLMAVAVHGEPGVDGSLTRRAQGHFLQSASALALTEAWPEGYNYWINSRAMVLALAAAAYSHGLQQAQLSPTVLQAMRRAGLWTVYATRPDNRIEALGDEGPRVDLKDETRRFIDLVAQLTNDSVFASYSSYLEALHRSEGYYRGYRWGFMLFNDPSVSLLPAVRPGSLEGLEKYLPPAEIFGAGAMNLFIARSGWGPNDTFISMRAGHTFTHHGHYDAGHFTLFKGAPLAINSSKYNTFFSPHRLYYGIRTIAKNSLLVVRPGDDVRPHPLIEKNINDGGQRLVIPTGSRVRNVEHWNSHLGDGDHFEGGELQDYHLQPGHFVYIRSDLTAAYDSTRYDSQGKAGKVTTVQRELLYLFDEDRLLVRDKVNATEASYAKKWLLHTINTPQVENLRVVLGNENAGILQSKADKATIENGKSRLYVKRILPGNGSMRLVGGAGYQFYVETDHSNSGSGAGAGYNFIDGAQDKPWFDNGAWRLEILPGAARKAEEFLVALSPSLGTDRSLGVEGLMLLSGQAGALVTPERVIVFAGGDRLGDFSFKWPGSQNSLLIAGVVSGDSFELEIDSESTVYEVGRSGVLVIRPHLEALRGKRVTVRHY